MAVHKTQMSVLVVTCFLILIDTLAVMTPSDTTLKYTEQADLSCNTCQFAIKELDYWLRMTGKKGHYSLEAAIAKSFESVCEKKESEDEEIRMKSIQCRELLDEHSLLIKEALVEHYESGQPGSYLKLIQEVCLEKLDLCSPGKQSAEDKESSMKLNPETNKMEVTFSGTIKTVNPVKESD